MKLKNLPVKLRATYLGMHSMLTNLPNNSVVCGADYYSLHLAECPGCSECDFLMGLYIACDTCGVWGNIQVEHYPQQDGTTMCQSCLDKLEVLV